MFSITKFGGYVANFKPLIPAFILTAHTKVCPRSKKAPKIPGGKEPKKSRGGPVCPGSGASSGADSESPTKVMLKRHVRPGKVRLGFIPEEWFLFFHSTTGVTGPYLFGIMLINYLVSKEKYVMEHEYYTGLSIVVMCYYVSTAFGPAVGAALDKEVDAVAESYEKVRKDEKAVYENLIKDAKDAQWRAEGQQLLMNAKKENITMQLEAIYRERLMHIYNTVRGRMDYHVKLYRAQARIEQKWMLSWILKEVMKSITPELEKQALSRAIDDLAAAAASRGS